MLTFDEARTQARNAARRTHSVQYAYEVGGNVGFGPELPAGATRMRFYPKGGSELFASYGNVWDVTLAADIVSDGRAPNGEVSTDRARDVRDGIVRISHDEYAPVDLSVPLIGLQFGEAGSVIIDGWHRIVEANARGVARLPIHWLSASEERRVRVNPRAAHWKAIGADLLSSGAGDGAAVRGVLRWGHIGKGWYRLMGADGAASEPLVSVMAQPRFKDTHRAWHGMLSTPDGREEIAAGRTVSDCQRNVRAALAERGDPRAELLP